MHSYDLKKRAFDISISVHAAGTFAKRSENKRSDDMKTVIPVVVVIVSLLMVGITSTLSNIRN